MNNNSNHNSRDADLDLTPATVFENFQECPEMLGPVAALFREGYPTDISTLRAALAARDQTNIAFVAHKIKGSVSCFNAVRAARIAAELERSIEPNEPTGTDNLLEQLEAALISVSAVLEQAERILADKGAGDLRLVKQ